MQTITPTNSDIHGSELSRENTSIIFIDHNHATTTSLVVAEKFDKQHKNVLQSIEVIIEKCPDERFRGLNFQPTFRDVPGPKNSMRQEKIYNLTRDGFVMLAMGFTGDKAFAWKIAFINAFNHMEQLLSAALITEHHTQAQELAAILDALFTRHPQWRETAEATQNGMPTRELAKRQGKSKSSVRAMKARIRAAGIDCRPVVRLTQQAA